MTINHLFCLKKRMGRCVSENEFFMNLHVETWTCFESKRKSWRFLCVFFVIPWSWETDISLMDNHKRIYLFLYSFTKNEDYDEAICNSSMSNSLVRKNDSSTTRNIQRHVNFYNYYKNEFLTFVMIIWFKVSRIKRCSHISLVWPIIS